MSGRVLVDRAFGDRATVDTAMGRLEWQEALFAGRLGRRALTAIDVPPDARRFHVHVVRNQPFEWISAAITPFLALTGIAVEFSYSGYDDSLLGIAADIPDGVHAVIVYIDPGRYGDSQTGDELAQWMCGRIAACRRRTSSPVLVGNWPERGPKPDEFNAALERWAATEPGAHVCDLRPVVDDLGSSFHDGRMVSVAGTSLSDQAQLQMARLWGLRWLPAALAPPRKALVVDFDNTLYGGVLGEDGPRGIVLTDSHLRLQQCLLDWRARGVMLAGATKNDPSDIDELFDARGDLLLTREDFAGLEAGWDPKSDMVARLADMLNVGSDSFVLVDDNPGELASVEAQHDGIGLILAGDPDLTARAVEWYPGLFTFSTSTVAGNRLEDIAASALRRSAAAEAEDESDYLRSLRMRLTLAVDNRSMADRLSELSNRTNQFNTSFRRFTESEVAEMIDRPDRCVVAVSLFDRFSDSGVIGAVFGAYSGGEVTIEEIDISCRALGRGLEKLIFSEAIRCLAGRWSFEWVNFALVRGPRNDPAWNTLGSLIVAEDVSNPEVRSLRWRWSIRAADAIKESLPVDVQVIAPES